MKKLDGPSIQKARDSANCPVSIKELARAQIEESRRELKCNRMPDATNPVYYARWKIQPLEFISENRLDFLVGNIIKYIMRYDQKNGTEDLKKARVYLDRLIEREKVKEHE